MKPESDRARKRNRQKKWKCIKRAIQNCALTQLTERRYLSVFVCRLCASDHSSAKAPALEVRVKQTLYFSIRAHIRICVCAFLPIATFACGKVHKHKSPIYTSCIILKTYIFVFCPSRPNRYFVEKNKQTKKRFLNKKIYIK